MTTVDLPLLPLGRGVDLGSERGVECPGDLPAAMRMIASEGRGVVVLLRDLSPKLPHLGEASPHTLRQYGVGAQILAALGIHELVLLTNTAPLKVVGLDGYGLAIHSTGPIPQD